MQGDDVNGAEISRGRVDDQDGEKMSLGNEVFSKFPSEASSELTNQEGTPTGSALSTDHDHDLQAPFFATDEAHSSANFYPFAFDYSSNLIQVIIKFTDGIIDFISLKIFEVDEIIYMLKL